MKLDNLQQAIYDRLAASSDVTDLLGSVPGGYQSHAIYDDAPQASKSEDDQFFPYLTMGDGAAAPFDTKTSNGGEVVAQVHIWSRSPKKATSAIHNAVYDALHKHDLAMTGANVINCLFDGSDLLPRDPDGITRHVVMRFRIVYELT